MGSDILLFQCHDDSTLLRDIMMLRHCEFMLIPKSPAPPATPLFFYHHTVSGEICLL